MRRVVCLCDRCGREMDTSDSMTYTEFMTWLGFDYINTHEKIRENIDLCLDCKKITFNTMNFIYELRKNK